MNRSFLSVFPSKIWLRLIVVFGGLTVLVLLFAELADEVREQSTVPFEAAFLESVNSISSPILDTFFVIVTQLGGALAVVAITAGLSTILWLRHHRRKAAVLAVGVAGAALLNLLLKTMFERTRPELWERLVVEQSYSFPSGHAMASSALAFSLIVIFWSTRYRWLVVASAVVYMLLIGFSRLYLGVHYPTDVIAGWLVSAAWVTIVVLVTSLKRR